MTDNANGMQTRSDITQPPSARVAGVFLRPGKRQFLEHHLFDEENDKWSILAVWLVQKSGRSRLRHILAIQGLDRQPRGTVLVRNTGMTAG